MPKKHGNQICILLHLQVDHCTNRWIIALTGGSLALTGGSLAVISQAAYLNSCDLFLFILVTRMKQLNYHKIVEENFNFAAQDIMERS